MIKKLIPEVLKKRIRHFKRGLPYYNLRGIRLLLRYRFDKEAHKYSSYEEYLVSGNERVYDDLYEDVVNNFEAILAPYYSENKGLLRHVFNNSFSTIDVELLYSIIRTYKPSLVIEIGAGYSTWFSRKALRKNKQGGRIISIDPNPIRDLPPDIIFIKDYVENVDVRSFSELKKNDILFIDSSHSAAEAEYHIHQIFPILANGVIIHHHGIVYPYMYAGSPPDWLPAIKRISEEERVILKFYNRNRDTFEVLTSSSFVRYKNPEAVVKLVPSFKWRQVYTGASLWVRKIS